MLSKSRRQHLLAILISDSGHANDLFSQLIALQASPTTNPETDKDILDVLEENQSFARNQAVQRLITTITDLRAAAVSVHGHPATYQRWALAVARFSFETYHLYTEPDPTRALADPLHDASPAQDLPKTRPLS